MKKYSTIIFITIFFFIILNTVNYSYASENIVNVSIVGDTFDKVLELVNILMVILNFGFVIFVFHNERKQNKKEEVKKYDEYWYNKFIIDNNIIILDTFFSAVNSLIKNISTDIILRNDGKKEMDILEYYEDVFTKWTNLHNECKSEFCEKIDVIMPNFAMELRNDFSKFQDFISNKINELLLCKDNTIVENTKTEILDKSNETKKEFIRKLYLKGKSTEK